MNNISIFEYSGTVEEQTRYGETYEEAEENTENTHAYKGENLAYYSILLVILFALIIALFNQKKK